MTGLLPRVRAITGMRRYLRLRPFDTSTAEGRARERYRRAGLTALASGAARAVSMIAVLVSIPLALSYLGTERYGVVVTITALTGMLVFADFGLGNGLMNLVAHASGSGDDMEAQRSISSAFAMLCGIAVAFTIVLTFLWSAVPWASFMNVTGSAASEIPAAAAVFLGVVVLNVPIGIAQRVQLAYQRGFVNAICSAAGTILSLVGLILVIMMHGSLAWVVLTTVGGPLLGNMLNWISLFVVQRPDLRPRLKLVRWPEARRLVRVGSLFFVLQLTIAVAYQSDVVVATRVIGPDAATNYSIVYRLFMVLPTIVNMLLLPLWPAYTESIARGDIRWVRRTLWFSIRLALILSSASSLLLVLVGPLVLRVWVGPQVDAPMGLMLGMAVWAVLSNSFNAVAMLLNGASVIGFQVATALTMSVASLGASIALANLVGVSGIVWGTVLAYLLCTALPTALYLPGLLRQLQSHPTPSQMVS